MPDSLQQLLQDIKTKGWDEEYYRLHVDLAISTPADIAPLTIMLVEESLQLWMMFSRVLDFMPLEDFPQVVEHALKVKSRDPQNEVADEIIRTASLQCLSSLHPHLTTIFEQDLNEGADDELWPWRESGTQHFDYLKSIIDPLPLSWGTGGKAWGALLETREKVVFDYLISRLLPRDFESERSNFQSVGFDLENGQCRQLYPSDVYHILFPKAYFGEKYPLYWKHPSWHIPLARSFTAIFGGSSTGECRVCGDKLDHILTLDPIPDWLPVTGIERLSLATCLSCLGREEDRLFYQHSVSGEGASIGYNGPLVQPQFVHPPFEEVEVQIAETPGRWRWQDWDNENLHRIGGYPTWVQFPDYPECPNCNSMMGFLLQLDSDISHGWWWGSGGLCYLFWCDQCKVSSYLYQCT